MSKKIEHKDNSVQDNFGQENSVLEYFAGDNPIHENSVQELFVQENAVLEYSVSRNILSKSMPAQAPDGTPNIVWMEMVIILSLHASLSTGWYYLPHKKVHNILVHPNETRFFQIPCKLFVNFIDLTQSQSLTLCFCKVSSDICQTQNHLMFAKFEFRLHFVNIW